MEYVLTCIIQQHNFIVTQINLLLNYSHQLPEFIFILESQIYQFSIQIKVRQFHNKPRYSLVEERKSFLSKKNNSFIKRNS